MQQQTSQTGSIDTLSFDNTNHSSLLLGDHKQVSVIFLKSALTKKLQQHFSIAFRKISTNNHSSSTARLRDRHRDCMRSVNQSDRKPPREKSQTERHSISSFNMFDDLMCFSEDVKMVLSQVFKCEKVGQMIESADRIREVVGLESRRLERLKNKERWREKQPKVTDTELAAVCIQKLLGYVAELGIGGEEVLAMRAEIESLKEKVEQGPKPNRDKESKYRADDNSVNKENYKAIQTLVTIMRDHKIANIKRKVEQEAKKLTDMRKELFDGVLAAITKTEVFEQANLSQITQLSSKLLQQQPTVEKNITHIEKQKRMCQKYLNEAKVEQTKVAYYNLIDTSIYLVKLYTNLKDTGNGNEINRIKSPPRVRKPTTTRTATKQKSSLMKSKITGPVQSIKPIEPFKEDLTFSRQEELSIKLEMTPLTSLLSEIKEAIIEGKDMMELSHLVEKYDNQDFKKIITIFYDIIQHTSKQSQDLKNFIETLSFDIQNMKVKQESFQQIIESRQYKYKQLIDTIEEIKRIFGLQEELEYTQITTKLSFIFDQMVNNKSNPERQQRQGVAECLITLLSSYFSSFSYPVNETPIIPKQLIAMFPQISLINQLINKSIRDTQIASRKYLEWNNFVIDLQNQIQDNQKEIGNKSHEIFSLKNTIENLSEQIYDLRKQASDTNLQNAEIDELKFEISLLKSQNKDSLQKYESYIQNLQKQNSENIMKIKSLQLQFQQQISESTFIIDSLKQQHLNQKHLLQTQSSKQAQKYKQLINKNTSLQSNIFLYRRQIESLKSQVDKTQSQMSQEQQVSSLRQQNALLREDVIEKSKMIQEFEVGQLSPRSMNSNVSGSMHSILETVEAAEQAFKKKNTHSSSDMLREYKPYNQQVAKFTEDKVALEMETRQLKQKLSELLNQRLKDEKSINQLKREMQLQQIQINNKYSQIERLRKEIDDLKRSQMKLQDRLRQYQIQQGSMIMKNTQKWTNQQSYLDSLDSTHNKSLGNIQDTNLLLRKIDYLQGQLYNQGAKLIKNNSMREQDLRILMSENQLIQEQVRDINNKLASERIKMIISPKSLEDSMRKMEFQLNKLRHEGVMLKDELRNAGSLEMPLMNQSQITPSSPAPKPVKPSYQFVTKKFSNSNSKLQPVKLASLPASPRTSKYQSEFKYLQKQNQTLLSRIRLLSVFTIIDQQNKAFVHNINKIISSVLQFLSTSQEFEECDYTDVDFMSTLTEYLVQEDYEGYFETLETFFKDLFLNVFERKNVEMMKQTDQLMFLKEKMEILLSEKIDQIEEEQEKLSYGNVNGNSSCQRMPFGNYNEEKVESMPYSRVGYKRM